MYTQILDLVKAEQEKFLKENKISPEKLRNNPKYLRFLSDTFRGLCEVAYVVAGDYRDSTDNHLLKAPGDEAREIIGPYLTGAVVPCMTSQLDIMSRMGIEQASKYCKLQVELMESRLEM
jgi:hypothetical protein